MADLRDERGNPIQLTDERGNPVQLTDEFGNPMHLTGVATSTVGGTTTIGGHEKPAGYGEGGVLHGGAGHEKPGYGEGGVLHGGTTTGTPHSTPTDYAKRGAAAVVGAGGATLGAAAGVGKAAGDATLGAATGVGKAAGDVMTGHAPGSRTHEERKLGQQLERSSSSSSSSEEDDGQGGRRKKKGLGQKIKEKLTGGKHKDKEEERPHSFSTTISSTTAAGQPHDPEKIRVEHHEHEKKGMMEKIKEKLPGHH